MIVRHLPRVLSVIAVSSACFMVSAAPSAFAETGTPAGNASCPRGFNGYTWASDFCFTGQTTYQVAGNVPGPSSAGLPGGNNSGAFIRYKVSLYAGAPCTNYLEGGVVVYGVNNGQEALADYIAGTAGGTSFFQLESTSYPIPVTVYWYQGTATLGMNFGAFNPSAPFVQEPNAGYGGCYNEAGTFIASSSTDLSSVTDGPVDVSNLAVYLPGGGGITSFPASDRVVDNPCGSTPCMNGSFYNNGTLWASGRG